MGLLQFNGIGARYENIFAGIHTNKFRNILRQIPNITLTGVSFGV